jgi:hypothetical protein
VETSTKSPVGTRVVLYLAILLVLGGCIYNGLRIYIDRQTYSRSVAELALQASAPVTQRIVTRDEHTEYERCERGFCWSAPDEESLKQVMEIQVGGNGGLPMVDTAAFEQALKQLQADYRSINN